MDRKLTTIRMRPFQLPSPPRLTLAGVSDDLAQQSAQRAASVKDYVIHAELEHPSTADLRTELAQQLTAHEPQVSLSTNGRPQLEITITGHDMWQAVLAAMVALTNAGCTPTTLHVAQTED